MDRFLDEAARILAAPTPRRQALRWPSLGFLGLALAYAVVSEGGRSFIDWNISLVLIGLVALAYWARTRDNPAPPLERWIAWLIALAPLSVAAQLIPLPMFLV